MAADVFRRGILCTGEDSFSNGKSLIDATKELLRDRFDLVRTSDSCGLRSKLSRFSFKCNRGLLSADENLSSSLDSEPAILSRLLILPAELCIFTHEYVSILPSASLFELRFAADKKVD